MLALPIFLTLTNCVSIRTQYPAITFYILETQPIDTSYPPIEAAIFIPSFTINAEYSSPRIAIVQPSGILSRSFYHRWAAPPEELVTESIVQQLRHYGIFAKGIYREFSHFLPEYLLTGHIATFAAYYDEQRNRYEARVSICFSLFYHAHTSSSGYEPLFQTTIAVSIPCNSDEIDQIAPAMSKAVSQLTRQLCTRILEHLSP